MLPLQQLTRRAAFSTHAAITKRFSAASSSGASRRPMTQDNIGMRVLAALTGVCTGIASGFLITDGDLTVLAALVVCVAGAVVLSAFVVPRDSWRDVLSLVAFATLLRAAVAVVLYDGLLAAGRGGFVTGDDAGYADLSWRLARILHHDPAPFNYGAESYLLGTFVYLETALFYVFGPKVLIVELINAAMGGMLIAFVYDIARRLFADVRAGIVAAILVAVYPSLVLWSALNLKDSLALLLIAMALWLVVIFQSSRKWWLVPAAFLPLLLMESLRNYIFVGLALVIPASVALAPGGTWRNRAVTNAFAFGLSGLFLVSHFTGVGSPLPSGLLGLEAQRIAMGIGAKTSYVDDPVVTVQSGTTYVVTTSAQLASPSPGASPTPTPRVIVVAPGTRLALVSGSSAASPSPGVFFVRPGDVVVVGGADATPAAIDQRKSLNIGAGTGTGQLVSPSDDDPLVGTLRYLPRGVAYVLFAPFPWSVSRALDLLPVPEMLLWYLALVGAALTVISYRRSRRLLLPLVLFVGGTCLILALAEGNVGTLFRHRAMVIPFVLILASPWFACTLARMAPRTT